MNLHEQAGTAFHEAAHAVAAILSGISLEQVELGWKEEEDGRISLGRTTALLLPATAFAGKGEKAVMSYLTYFFAGAIAELYINQHVIEDNESFNGDAKSARNYATMAICTPIRVGNQMSIPLELQAENSEEIAVLLAKAFANAKDFVQVNQVSISNVAEALITGGRLTADQVANIVQSNSSETHR
jgi:hypothetical protein